MALNHRQQRGVLRTHLLSQNFLPVPQVDMAICPEHKLERGGALPGDCLLLYAEAYREHRVVPMTASQYNTEKGRAQTTDVIWAGWGVSSREAYLKGHVHWL